MDINLCTLAENYCKGSISEEEFLFQRAKLIKIITAKKGQASEPSTLLAQIQQRRLLTQANKTNPSLPLQYATLISLLGMFFLTTGVLYFGIGNAVVQEQAVYANSTDTQQHNRTKTVQLPLIERSANALLKTNTWNTTLIEKFVTNWYGLSGDEKSHYEKSFWYHQLAEAAFTKLNLPAKEKRLSTPNDKNQQQSILMLASLLGVSNDGNKTASANKVANMEKTKKRKETGPASEKRLAKQKVSNTKITHQSVTTVAKAAYDPTKDIQQNTRINTRSKPLTSSDTNVSTKMEQRNLVNANQPNGGAAKFSPVPVQMVASNTFAAAGHQSANSPIAATAYNDSLTDELTSSELHKVANQLVSAYEKGDIYSFVSLFSDDAQTNDQTSLSGIKTDYIDLFNSTSHRKMHIQNLSWSINDSLAIGKGKFEVLVQPNTATERHSVTGDIQIVAERLDDQVFITRLFHTTK